MYRHTSETHTYNELIDTTARRATRQVIQKTESWQPTPPELLHATPTISVDIRQSESLHTPLTRKELIQVPAT